ncbi:MAG: Glu/Leu/Phe/Val dehydrogenase dimerization domain-containing protein [Pseudomonadota bacterium]
MPIFTHAEFDGHEGVFFAEERAAGLRTIIAIHDTRLGPALGGCRIWPYADENAALTDVLRLSRGMSFKAALAGLPLGGGKSVILADARHDKTPEMMRAMGRAVDRLAGAYIVAEDVGASVADMDEVARETRYVSGTSAHVGDPSPWTAEGVALAMETAVARRLNRGFDGLRVTITGLGHVGANLARRLAAAGALLTLADIRDDVANAVAAETGGTLVDPATAHASQADVFAPCALGAVLNRRSIPEIGAPIVCGAANNQLAEASDDARLVACGILYCPDYLVNAGGLISVARPITGMDEVAARAALSRMPETLTTILDTAEDAGMPPGAAADRLARDRMGAHEDAP